MVEADIRFQQTWEQYAEELKKNFHCSLSKFCRRTRTSYSGLCTWLSRRGYSVGHLKQEILNSHYGGSLTNTTLASGGKLVPVVPSCSLQEEVSLFGVSVTFNSGTTVTVKQGTPGGILELIRSYERKEGESCTL
jgi:hypothetical protein